MAWEFGFKFSKRVLDKACWVWGFWAWGFESGKASVGPGNLRKELGFILWDLFKILGG